MIRFVHQDLKFVKRLETLYKEEKKAVIAAGKAEEIIRLLKNQGDIRPSQVVRTRSYTEKRIKNCIKYDLGSGYRLITVKEGEHLFILYIGNHNDYIRWIENNKELEPCLIKHRCTTFSVVDTEIDSEAQHGNVASATASGYDVDEENPLADLDDKILRRIFCGLIGENP
ncbi:MAG TPA: hypothetical protein HPQ03_02460 [Deltaproteobacteria bacterium]|nr:hypothetical protein [Deltaproteobacteria bacterium]